MRYVRINCNVSPARYSGTLYAGTVATVRVVKRWQLKIELHDGNCYWLYKDQVDEITQQEYAAQHPVMEATHET